jgi:hypothetical protein
MWMFLVSALFYTILLSDMLSDDIGFLAARKYWCSCFIVLVLVLLVYVWLLHEFMSRPVLTSGGEREGSASWCPAWLSMWWCSCRDALAFVWDLCFGDGELHGNEDRESPSQQVEDQFIRAENHQTGHQKTGDIELI